MRCDWGTIERFLELFSIGFAGCCTKPVAYLGVAVGLNVVTAFLQTVGNIPYSMMLASLAEPRFYRDGDSSQVATWGIVLGAGLLL